MSKQFLSLQEQPRHEPAGIISSRQQESIIDWLERTGRFRDIPVDEGESLLADSEDDLDITDLIDGGGSYDDDADVDLDEDE